VNRGRLAGLFAITITSLLWGTTGTAATFAPGAGPLAIGAFALGVGGLLQAVVAIPALRTERVALRQQGRVVIVGALAVAIYPLVFYSSMHTAGVAVGSVVSLASAPLASGVLERLIDTRPLNRWWMLAAALGLIGTTLLCVSKLQERVGSAAATILGIVLGLLAGATYATYSWAARRLMSSGICRGASMGAVFGGGGLLLIPVLALAGAPLLASPQNAAVGAYMALVPMFLGYLLFGYGLTKVPASTATTVTLTEPAVATVLAVFIVGEHLGVLGWTGLAVIAAVLVILVATPTNADPKVRTPRMHEPLASVR
jgi:DME family drug/metabolite transporter